MHEWWTYRLEDLILFDAHTYYRLIELYNESIWPLQLISIALSIFLAYLVVRRPPWHGRGISLVLALSWLWVAWAFHWERFSDIHWVATYYAIIFVVQALLIIWVGIIKNQFLILPLNNKKRMLGLSLLAFSLIIQPLFLLPFGHPLSQAELFTLTPDPTVIATLALLLIIETQQRVWLITIPLIWCVVSGATLFALDSPSIMVLILAPTVTFISLIYKTQNQN